MAIHHEWNQSARSLELTAVPAEYLAFVAVMTDIV
jgi:hypothetical protein